MIFLEDNYKAFIEAFGYPISHIAEESDHRIKFFKSMDDAFHQSFNVATLDEETKELKIFDNENNLLETLRLP